MPSLGVLPSIIIVLYVLLGMIIGALFGLLRGFKRSIITIIGTVSSAILAFLVAKPIASWVTKTVLGSFDLRSLIENYDELMEASPALEEFISVLPTAIIAPILFILLFGIFKLIAKIPCGIISLSMGSKSHRRLLGMPIGAAQGLISSLVVVFVITGFISTADNIVSSIMKDDTKATEEIRETLEPIDEIIDSTKKDPVVGILCRNASEDSNLTTSVNFVYSGLTSFSFRNEKAKLNEEVVGIIDTVMCLTPLMSNEEGKEWGEDEIHTIEKFADRLSHSVILSHISTDLISGMSEKWANEETFMGIERPRGDETVDPLIKALFVVLKDTSAATIEEDFNTVIDIIKTCDEYGVLSQLSGGSDSEELLNALKGDFVSELMTILSANERFSILVPEVTNLGLRLLATTLHLPENNQEIYGEITAALSSDLNEILAEGVTEEKAVEFAEKVSTILADNGIEASEEVSDIVAEALVNSFDESGQISPDEIQDFFQDFAVVYEAVGNGGSNQTRFDSVGAVNLSGNRGNGSREFSGDLDSMSYSDKIEYLASIGVYDHYNSVHDLSSPYNKLSNGRTAENFVNYIIRLSFTVNSNYDKLEAMGDSSSNPIIALRSPETIITTKVTTESLMIGSDVKLSNDDIQQIGEGFGSLATFLTSYAAADGNLDMDSIGDLDLASAGKALDAFKNIGAFSGTVDKLSTAVISNVVGSNVNIVDKINSGNVTYEDLFTTVKSTVQVINNISKAEASEEEKEQAILDLLLNLTPETAGIVNEVITVDLVIKQGAPKENAAVAVKALRVAFTEMAALPAEEHEAEAAYIKLMFELSVFVQSEDKQDDIIGPDGLFKSEKDLVYMSVKSKVAAAAVKAMTTGDNGETVYDPLNISEKLSDENRANITAHMEELYNESKGTASSEELKELEARLLSASYLLELDLDFMN